MTVDEDGTRKPLTCRPSEQSYDINGDRGMESQRVTGWDGWTGQDER